jgi:hypothetical protein
MKEAKKKETYHIVSQRNNNELRILGPFLNIGGDNRNLQREISDNVENCQVLVLHFADI